MWLYHNITAGREDNLYPGGRVLGTKPAPPLSIESASLLCFWTQVDTKPGLASQSCAREPTQAGRAQS